MNYEDKILRIIDYTAVLIVAGAILGIVAAMIGTVIEVVPKEIEKVILQLWGNTIGRAMIISLPIAILWCLLRGKHLRHIGESDSN